MRTSSVIRASLLAASVAALRPGHALADDSPESRARALFEEGVALREAAKWEEACVKFQAAHETFATGGTALSYADCEERHGNNANAKTLYEFILADPKSASNEERLAAARVRLDAVNKLLEEEAKKKPTPTVEPGPIVPRKPDAPATPSTKTKMNPVPGGVLLGVGGAILATGGILGGVALAGIGAVKDACDGNVCPKDKEADADQAKALGIGADVCFGVGGAAAITGLVLLFTVRSNVEGGAVTPTANGFLVRF